MRTSTRAQITSKDLLRDLTSIRFDVRSTQKAQEFVVEWLEKLRKYEDLKPMESHFPDSMKKTLLENSLSASKTFKDITHSEVLSMAQGGTAIEYHNYLDIVQKMAESLDHKLNEHKGIKKLAYHPINRSIKKHHHMENEEIQHDPEGWDEDDASDEEIIIKNTQRCVREYNEHRTRLKWESWKRLDDSSKAKWDEFSDEIKAIILSGGSQMGNSKGNNRIPKNVKAHVTENSEEEDPRKDGNEEEDQPRSILDSLRNGEKVNPGDLRNVFSSNKPKKWKVNTMIHQRSTSRVYKVSSLRRADEKGSLVDRGANGGLAGGDVRLISKTDGCVDIVGIDEHRIQGLPIATVGGKSKTNQGTMILIFHQYAYNPLGRTIHSSIQMEAFDNLVNDKSSKVKGGTQKITVPTGEEIPLDIVNGLPYMDLSPYTDEEWKELPHMVMTSDEKWDPTIFDSHQEISGERITTFADWHKWEKELIDEELEVHSHEVRGPKVNYNEYKDYFLGVP